MQKSAVQLKIEAQLQASIDLLKRAKPYVGRATTIGGQDLSREITEFVAGVDRNPVVVVVGCAHNLKLNPQGNLRCAKCQGETK